MATSALAGRLGTQRPRVESFPDYGKSAGADAVALAADAGLVLDDWQSFVLERALGVRPDGKWSAFEVGLVLPRQNGKGAILEARELAGLFLFDERLILHSAHEFKTAQEAFRRILSLIEGADWLSRRVLRVRTSHGDEGIELKSGGRLRFVARSGGSGRGFSGDTIILDEAMILGPEAMAALLPTLSARPNPQLWYTASAGTPASVQLRSVRDRGLVGSDPSLAYFEWSAEPRDDPDDPDVWARANPALGIRVPEEFVAKERVALPEMEFLRERLGIWDDGALSSVIDLDLWESLTDARSAARDPVAFALDVTPDRSSASIAMAGWRRGDGLAHVEVVENKRGTTWAVARVAELAGKWRPCAVVVDPGGPAGSLVPSLTEAGVDLTLVSTRELGNACGAFFDRAQDKTLRHIGQPVLNAALGAARKRPLGDSWAWHRRDATDISPLVAVTLALHGLTSNRQPATFIPTRIR